MVCQPGPGQGHTLSAQGVALSAIAGRCHVSMFTLLFGTRRAETIRLCVNYPSFGVRWLRAPRSIRALTCQGPPTLNTCGINKAVMVSTT